VLALLALDPDRGLFEVVDHLANGLLDLLVGRDACRDRARPPGADELVVDLARRGDRALDVLADFLVLKSPLHVRLRVVQPVLRVGHPGHPFVSSSFE
jgi:hypothetical protein